MLAANLDQTQSSSSHPPILSITAMAEGNSAFVWMAFSRSSLSSTKDCQNCLRTHSLVNLALALSSADGSSSFFVKSDFLFFPCRRTRRRNSVRLSSDYQPREQVPKTSILENLSRGDSCHRGSTQTTTTEGQTPPPGAETRISHIQRFLCWTTSRMIVRIQTPSTSAVMAVNFHQRYRNFADCDPRVFVCSRDDNTTTTSAIHLRSSIPEAT